jgi:hypothetical protein
MSGRVEMLGGMLILRIVAAADMTTDEADTQVHPGVTIFRHSSQPLALDVTSRTWSR